MTVVNKASGFAPNMEVVANELVDAEVIIDAKKEPTALTTIHDAQVMGIKGDHSQKEVNDEFAAPAGVYTTEQAKTEAKTVTEVKEVTPAEKAAAKSEKASTIAQSSKN